MNTPFNRMNVDFIEDSKKRQIKTAVNVYSARRGDSDVLPI